MAVDGEMHSNEHLVQSDDSKHPANLICELCKGFYALGWVRKPFVTIEDIEELKILPFQVTGTGGGTSIRHDDHIYIAPSGVQKERLEPSHMFVMDFKTREYLRKPAVRSECFPCAIDAGQEFIRLKSIRSH